MKTGRESSDVLTKRLLSVAGHAESAQGGTHPDEEQIALFCTGTLHGSELDQLAVHLADCDLCRQLVAAVLKAEVEPIVPLPASPVAHRALSWFSTNRWLLVAAAGLLLTVSLLFMRSARSPEQLAYLEAREALQAGNFEVVQRRITQVADAGIVSDRLRSLAAQAERRMPDPLALSVAGRLTDFGFQIDGTVARGPASPALQDGLVVAREMLERAGNSKFEAVLNRGHVLLSLNEPKPALDQFKSAERLSPKSALASLGSGLALYMLDDFVGAELAFRRASELDPDNVAAWQNLAMTLEEHGQSAEAIAIWRKVLERKLLPDERNRVNLHLRQLEIDYGK